MEDPDFLSFDTVALVFRDQPLLLKWSISCLPTRSRIDLSIIFHLGEC
jgi:hypothetical protein